MSVNPALVTPTRVQIALPIAVDHPAFSGHFPGQPIVPGVVLLDHALHVMSTHIGVDLSACHITAIKFLSPVTPGDMAMVQFGLPGLATGGALRFDVLVGERKAATGAIRLPPGIAPL